MFVNILVTHPFHIFFSKSREMDGARGILKTMKMF
jgi:hypothetical protein